MLTIPPTLKKTNIVKEIKALVLIYTYIHGNANKGRFTKVVISNLQTIRLYFKISNPGLKIIVGTLAIF